MCRKALPLPAAAAPAPAPVVIQQQQQQPQPQQPMSIFNRLGGAFRSVFTPATSDEDPVTPSAATSTSTRTGVVPTVTVSAAPEYTEVSRDEHQNFHVRVSLKYEEVEALSAMKVPLDVVCVLDNSGSMSGGKLDSLKKAMDFVIQTLGPNDRLSVINFNSHPTVLHGLLKMSPANQGTAKSRIHALNATGGTNILEGMQQGWSSLENRQTRNPASCMFLLTDGQDRDNTQEKLELARRMKSAGTSLFVFGFGTDHDSEHMVSPVTIVPMIVF
jgi:Mg-chelatase subunit ChlD